MVTLGRLLHGCKLQLHAGVVKLSESCMAGILARVKIRVQRTWFRTMFSCHLDLDCTMANLERSANLP